MSRYLILTVIATWKISLSLGFNTKPVNLQQRPSITQDSISKQAEIDEIFSLLTYALVYLDWQSDSLPRDQRRGYNIGALLVNQKNEPVLSDLNCINQTNNSTQHAEVRLITKYLSAGNAFNLKGYTVYTTLEPCAMCAGMILMSSTKRVVYGQHDVEFSKAFERLSLDNRPNGGLGPYPRTVSVSPSPSELCQSLDAGFARFLETDSEKILAKFLTSPNALRIYSSAHEQLFGYKVKYQQNAEILEGAVKYYNAHKKH